LFQGAKLDTQRYSYRMNKPLTFLLSLTFLFLFSGSVYGDDFQDGFDAKERKDYKEAVRLFRLSAEQGDARAQVNLALSYHFGDGVPQNYKEAIKWYRLSAEQGHAGAQSNLGYIYAEGKAVPQNHKEAGKWYRLSAEQGYATAQEELGLMYFKGQGVLQDYVLAHMWFNICGSGGGREDCAGNRNRVERKMSRSQIEKAQEMARNWKPKQESKGFFEQFKEKFGIK